MNPNKLKIVYSSEEKRIRLYQMENDQDIQDIPESYEKYFEKDFIFNHNTIQQSFFEDILSPFAVPTISVLFYSSEEIYCEFFKLSSKLYGRSNGCKIGTVEYIQIDKTESSLADNSNTDENDYLTPIEKAKIRRAEEYYYEKNSYEDPDATPKNALNIIHSIFLNHKNKEYVLSVYLPIYITVNANSPIDEVEKFLGNLDKDFIPVQLAYIDLYLINQNLEKAEHIASKLYEANSDNILVKCRYILVLLAAWKKYNSEDFLKAAIKYANSLSSSKNILENSWIQRTKYLVELRQGTKSVSEFSEYPENVYKNFMKGGVLSVGYSIFDEYSLIQDAIDNAAENEPIYLSKGIYKESFTIEKKVKLIGDQSVIVVPRDETCNVRSDVLLKNLVFTNKEYVTYSDVTEDVKRSKNSLPDEKFSTSFPLVNSSGNSTVSSCTFINGLGGAIQVMGSGNAKLDNTIILNNLKYGINASDESKISVKESQLKGNKIGIELYKKSNSDIYNTEFINNYGVAIQFNDDSKGRVDKCKLYFKDVTADEKSTGILIKDAASPKVSNTSIKDYYTGMLVQDRGKPISEDCQFVANKQYGLFIKDSAAGIYSRCMFSEICSPNENRDSSEENESAGIKIYSSCIDGLQIDDCTVSENTIGILVEDGAPQIEDCDISNNSTSGIKCSAGHPIVRGLKLTGNSKVGMWITGNATGEYSGYDVSYDTTLKTTNTNQIGILVDGDATPLFKDGFVHDNYRAGIFRDNSYVKISEMMDVFSNTKGIDGDKKKVEGKEFIHSHNNSDSSITLVVNSIGSIKAKLVGGK